MRDSAPTPTFLAQVGIPLRADVTCRETNVIPEIPKFVTCLCHFFLVCPGALSPSPLQRLQLQRL